MQTKNKKTNNKVTLKVSSVLALLLVFVTFTQCVETLEVQEVEVVKKDKPVVPDDEIHKGIAPIPTEGSVSNEFVETGATEVARAVSSVGIKDFEQIYRSMSVLTGVDPANHNSIRSAYGDLNTQLPNENSVKQFNSENQFDFFKLGSEFCDVMMNDANYYNPIFDSVNMGQSPNQALNAAGKAALVQDLMDHFWGVGVQDATMMAQSKLDLVVLIDDLLVGENLGSAATTRKVAKGVCASIIATPQITML